MAELIEVEQWTWHNDQFWQSEVVGDPDINSTGSSQEESQDYLVVAWNNAKGQDLTKADFHFVMREES